MKTAFVWILALLVLAGCSPVLRKTVKVNFNADHYWEYVTGNPMWRTLVWFDGSSIRRATIASGARSFEVEVERGATCIFAVYPLGSLAPAGGGLSPSPSGEVKLCFGDGRLADLLLDIAEVAPEVVAGLDWDKAKALIPSNFDDDSLYASFLDGTFGKGGVERAKAYDIGLEGLGQGKWHGENDWSPALEPDPEGRCEVELTPGVHRWYNPSRGIARAVAVYSDGSSSWYDYSLPLW